MPSKQPVRGYPHFTSITSIDELGLPSVSNSSTTLARPQSSRLLPSAPPTTAASVTSYVSPLTTSITSNATTTSLSGSECHKNCTFSKLITVGGHWQKCQTEANAVVGQIQYIVDEATNKTITTTSYADVVTFTSNGTLMTSAVSDLVANGSKILVRTDVNAAGTVTVGGENWTMCVLSSVL